MTRNERTAIVVALIGLASAVLVALIAHREPAAAPPQVATLAPGDRRLIPAWGRSNDGVARQLTIRNATSQPIVRLLISSIAEKSEGPDRLGGVPVPPGGSIDVVADDGSGQCQFDMRAVFADGRELWQGSFNVCAGMGFFWSFGSHEP